MKLRQRIIQSVLIISTLMICSLFVTNSVLAARTMTLNKTSVKIAVGKTYTLKASNVEAGKKVIWNTSNQKIATVKNGIVTAKTSGTTTITAKCGTLSKTCKIIVYQPAKSVKLAASSSYVEVGDTFTVKNIVTPKDATYQKLEWSVQSDSWWDYPVEYVSGNQFKALAEGKAIILGYQKDTNKTYKLEVVVKAALGAFHIECFEEEVSSLATYPGGHLIVNATFEEGYYDEEYYDGEERAEEVAFSIKDPSIATVDKYGQITGIKEGTTTIIATAVNRKTKECKLVVAKKPNDIVRDEIVAPQMKEAVGFGGYNYEGYLQDYNYASVDCTQILVLPNNEIGVFNRIIPEDGRQQLNVTIYNQSYQFVESKVIELPYTQWGGIYKGTDGYYYVAVGQTNKEESDTKIVYSIIKYDGEFKELARCNIIGSQCNTTIPFYAGNCSMDMSGTTLVIHTCRERYMTEDGLNHQSNITFVIDTTTMNQSYVGAKFPYNHVSHSFNQFVKFDGNNLIYVDHGDAYPRSVVMQTHFNFFGQAPNDNYSSRPGVNENNLITIMGDTGDNVTGTRVDGFELGTYNNIVAGVSIPHDNLTGDVSNDAIKNVYVVLTTKDGYSSELKWLTHYSEDSGITTKNLRVVKINDNEFGLIYEINKGDNSFLGFMLIDSNGTILKEMEWKGKFSGDVQPAVYQGDIVWLNTKVNYYDYEPINGINYFVRINMSGIN